MMGENSERQQQSARQQPRHAPEPHGHMHRRNAEHGPEQYRLATRSGDQMIWAGNSSARMPV